MKNAEHFWLTIGARAAEIPCASIRIIKRDACSVGRCTAVREQSCCHALGIRTIIAANSPMVK